MLLVWWNRDRFVHCRYFYQCLHIRQGSYGANLEIPKVIQKKGPNLPYFTLLFRKKMTWQNDMTWMTEGKRANQLYVLQLTLDRFLWGENAVCLFICFLVCVYVWNCSTSDRSSLLSDWWPPLWTSNEIISANREQEINKRERKYNTSITPAFKPLL